MSLPPLANILIDAMLPLTGCIGNPVLPDLELVFDETEGGYVCRGWVGGGGVVEDGGNVYAPLLSYAPVLPYGQTPNTYANAMIGFGDARDPSVRYLKLTVIITLTPPTVLPWATLDNNSSPLADYGTSNTRVITYVITWNPELHPTDFITMYGTSNAVSGGGFYSKVRNSDGSVTETCSVDALRDYDVSPWGNPSNIATALNYGGSLNEASHETESQSGEGYNGSMTVFDWANWDDAHWTSSYAVKRELPYECKPYDGPTEGDPTFQSVHDEVQEILDSIDLSDSGKQYTFHDSGSSYPTTWVGPGTAKTVTLRANCYYYIIPFWVAHPTTGDPTTQRRYDILEVELWPNVQFRDDPERLFLSDVAIYDPGSGFVVDQILTLAGGTGTAAQVRVTEIGAGGSITAVEIHTLGSYSVQPEGLQNIGLAQFYFTFDFYTHRTTDKDVWWVDNCGFGMNGSIGAELLPYAGVGWLPVNGFNYVEDFYPTKKYLPAPEINWQDFNTNLLLKVQRRVREYEAPYSPTPTYHLSKAGVDERERRRPAQCCLIQHTQHWGTMAAAWPYYPDWPDLETQTADGGTYTHDFPLRNGCNGSYRTGQFELVWSDLTPLDGERGVMGILLRAQQVPWSIFNAAQTVGPVLDLDPVMIAYWPGCCHGIGTDQTIIDTDRRPL